MDAAQRIARATPFEAASTSIGLGLFLVWLSQAPSRALLPVAPILEMIRYMNEDGSITPLICQEGNTLYEYHPKIRD